MTVAPTSTAPATALAPTTAPPARAATRALPASTTVVAQGPFGRHPPAPWAYFETNAADEGGNNPLLVAEDLSTGEAHVFGAGRGVAVAPDRTAVAWTSFTVQGASEQWYVWVTGAGGAHPTEVAPPTDSIPFALAWSPDSSALAYAANVSGGGANDNEIVVVARSGGHRVLTNGAQVRLYMPDGHKLAWSPDGTQLAFVSAPGGDAVVELADTRTGEVTQLTSGDTGYNDLWWLPDGKALLAVTMQGAVARVNTDGSGATTVVGDLNVTDLVLSPDGATAAVSAARSVLVMNADGTGRRDVLAGAVTGAPGGFSGAWSPDGSALLIVKASGAVVAVRVSDGAQTAIRSEEDVAAWW